MPQNNFNMILHFFFVFVNIFQDNCTLVVFVGKTYLFYNIEHLSWKIHIYLTSSYKSS